MEKIVLSLGSNIGNRLDYLRQAVSLLCEFTTECKVSSVYSTKPQDYILQDDFLNIVFVALYEGSPESLLQKTQNIEAKLGRERVKSIPKGPRTIDIDILLFGKKCINTKKLTIPHPAMKKRQFVLIPLLEVLPEFTEPISNTPYSFFLSKLQDQGVVKYTSPEWSF